MLHSSTLLLSHTCKDSSHLSSNLAYTVYKSTVPATFNLCLCYERRHFCVPTLRAVILCGFVLFLSQNITQVRDVNISAEKTEEEETLAINEPKSPSVSWPRVWTVQVHSWADFPIWSHTAESTSGQSPTISLSLYQSFKKYIWESLAQKVKRLHSVLGKQLSSHFQFCHWTNNTSGFFGIILKSLLIYTIFIYTAGLKGLVYHFTEQQNPCLSW